MKPDKLSKQDVLIELKDLVQSERELVARVLNYLLEVESNKWHLEMGYSSMFAFCCEYLGYSEMEAQLRIQAMRLMKSVPEIAKKIEDGDLSLSVAAKAQAAIRQFEKNDRELKNSEKREIVNDLVGVSARQAERKLATRFPQAAPPEKMRAISEDLTTIQFTANRRFIDKIEKLKGLLAHKNFDGRLDVLFEELADIALNKLDPETKIERAEKKSVESAPKNDTAVLSTCLVKARHGNSRYIPAKTRRQVWRRAGSQCEWWDPVTKKRCSCRHGLQVDHIIEFASGGGHQLENLRLLCGAHNRFRNFAKTQASSS